MTSRHFSEKIRELEKEGVKLLAATHSLGDSLHLENEQNQSKVKSSEPGISAQLSALADISAEQKTIADLSKNLDEQCRETNRIHREMFNTSGSYREPPLPSTLSNLEIPISSDYSATRPKSYHTDFLLKDCLHGSGDSRQLRESQREVSELRSRLKETLSILEQQKSHFRQSVEDLRGQLNVVTTDRDSIAQKSKRDAGDKSLMIDKLQETVRQLERNNKVQEETLIELNEKLEQHAKDKYMIDTSVSQMRSLLYEREHRRKRPFYDSEPISKQPISVLVHSVDKCLQDLEYEAAQKQDRIDQLLLEIDDIKVSAERKEDKFTLDHDRKFSKLQEEHERAFLRLTEQCSDHRDQAVLLQDRVNTLEKQLDQQTKGREDEVRELETRMYTLRQEHDTERREWLTKKSALEMALDESQRDLALAKGDKESSIRTTAQIESRFSDMQSLLEKLNRELTEERENNRHLQEKETEVKAAQERLQIQVKHKDQVLADLEQRMKSVKQEADTQIQSAISSMEKEGKAYIEKEISSLKTQVEALTDRCHKLQLELEVTKSEYRNIQERHKEAKENLEKTTSQLEQANSKKESFNAVLSEKVNDIERLTHEKDYYFKLIDERNQEISTLNALKEKLKIQLEEREKNFMTLQQQNDKMSELMKENSRGSSELRSERDILKQQYSDKAVEVEETKKLNDQLTKKMQVKEKRIQELEEENKKLSQELGEKKSEIGTVTREKEKLFGELKTSRYEVSRLEDTRKGLEKQLENKETDMSKELSRLNRKVKAAEQDVKLAKKTLKTREEVDGKAVKVAGKMQKEVTEKRGEIDSLQTRIRWLKECLDAAIKDKTVVQEENEKLAASIVKLGKQNDRLSHELQNHITKSKTLREKISTLESALEKAAVKNAAMQAEVEEQQQEMARLQLKHQLQLKETNRNIKNYYNPVEQSKSQPSTENTAKTTSLSYPAKVTPALANYHLTEEKTTSLSYPAKVTPALANYHLTEEKPVRDKPAKTKHMPTESGDNAVGHELRNLLDEMKNVLQGQRKQPTSRSRSHFNESSVLSDSELDPRSHRHRKSSRDRHGYRASRGKVREKQRSASPESLVIHTDGAQSDTMLSPTLDETHGTYFAPRKGSYNAKRQKPIVLDSQDVCKRLEKKIENLSKMGSHLQQENKEMAKVMKDQDKKLKKVKSQMVK